MNRGGVELEKPLEGTQRRAVAALGSLLLRFTEKREVFIARSMMTNFNIYEFNFMEIVAISGCA